MIVILKEDIELAVVPQFIDGVGLIEPSHTAFDYTDKQYQLLHELTWACWYLGYTPDIKPYHYANLVIDHWHDTDDTIYTDVFNELLHEHIIELNQGIRREL